MNPAQGLGAGWDGALDQAAINHMFANLDNHRRGVASSVDVQAAVERSAKAELAVSGIFPGQTLHVVPPPVATVHTFWILTRDGVRTVEASYAAFANTHMAFYIEMPEGQGDKLILALAADHVREVSIIDEPEQDK